MVAGPVVNPIWCVFVHRGTCVSKDIFARYTMLVLSFQTPTQIETLLAALPTGSSAWLFHVPKSLASKAEAVLSTLNKRTLTITRGGSLLVVAGCRWVLGLKKL